MRILWSSNSVWTRTGYGVQTALFLNRIRRLGHEIAMFAWYGLEGGMLNIDNIPTYPKGGHPYGADILPRHAQHFNADIVITLIDLWVQEPLSFVNHRAKFCPWFPVDSEPIPPLVLQKARESFAPIVFSQFAVKELEREGVEAFYVPHGVDTQYYRPLPQSQSREALGFAKDKFIVGMVAANKGFPCRKSIPQCMQAFARFHRHRPESFLFLHTSWDTMHAGADLRHLAHLLGIQEAVGFVDQYGYHVGLNNEYMVNLYNSFDVLLNPAMGEGFGVPILEAQSCGVPVITGDWTAMPEITFSGCTIPKNDAEVFYTQQNTFQYLPRVSAIEHALHVLYHAKQQPDAWQKLKLKAREGACAYDADKVTDQFWKPVLEQIEKRIAVASKLQERFNSCVSVSSLPARGHPDAHSLPQAFADNKAAPGEAGDETEKKSMS